MSGTAAELKSWEISEERTGGRGSVDDSVRDASRHLHVHSHARMRVSASRTYRSVTVVTAPLSAVIGEKSKYLQCPRRLIGE